MRPWFAHLLLLQPHCEKLRAIKGYSVLDQIIGDEARNNRIPVIGLETIGEQIEAFARLSEPAHLGFLKQVLKASRTGEVQNELETLFQLYLTRRLDLAIPMQIEKGKSEGIKAAWHDEFDDIFLLKRNDIMRDRSLTLLEKGGAFIAVGALHIVGEKGLVALYRDAGYTVTPIE